MHEEDWTRYKDAPHKQDFRYLSHNLFTLCLRRVACSRVLGSSGRACPRTAWIVFEKVSVSGDTSFVSIRAVSFYLGSTDSFVAAPDEANVSAYPPIGDEEEPGVDRYARPVSKLNFYAGCFLAFLSGFLTMFNNFLIKETGSDFGELIAIRSLLQIAAMLALSKVMGRRMYAG